MEFNDEIGALGRAAGDAADRLAMTPAQGVHAAIADRVFRNLGEAALPARALHDGISIAVYAGVRVGIKTGTKAGALIAKARGTDPELVSRTRRGSQVQSILNGLIGHELALEDDALAVQLGFWRDGLPLSPAEVEGRKIVVFVHGLFETEGSWTTADGRCYGDQLRDQGWEPLYLRYNSGLPIIENGRKLAWLLDEIDCDQLALVGHSMGGLVVRVAGHEGGRWRDKLSHVACLGTPNQGAPIAGLVHRAAGLLAKLPETAPFGAFLDQRSAGIRDLQEGIDAGPLLEGVHHLFLGATFTADPKHPIGLLVGDFLVREGSARGPRDIEIEDAVHLGGLHHFQLLNHERVFEHLERFLLKPATARRALPA